ncbi:prolipoprotein diacylglyceryl transferase [Isachenkonia alkalipeptolytica]|uniref:Phosphatidylglycerol--prolipoprotein diacylglyceryl transferase n=1 Tax=Isachenkonia alkalipeptolytica TaxID=2565777 RepID=A0AA44BE04_9CLOT|nr:prolipoprotein diacylglyceryl transferase [Isachenkonia alkalipeptolytica]NBG88512.1 prolipoprotein diacylglyceryl transferase [Isachenkonia alkalipeptolytica]
MNQIAFTIFGVDVAWYGIIISFGMILGVVVASIRANRAGLHSDTIVDMSIVAIPLAIIGARVYYFVFTYNPEIHSLLDVFSFRSGGLAIHGGLIGGVLGGYLFTKYKNIYFWKLADIVAPSIILGQAIGRWGNYVNQEAHGGPTDLPWAIEVNGEMVHPTFLYESLWNIGVFVFLLVYSKKKKVTGEVFLLYIALYSLGRIFIEGLRTDSLMLGQFRVAQLISVALILAAFGIRHILIRKKTH